MQPQESMRSNAQGVSVTDWFGFTVEVIKELAQLGVRPVGENSPEARILINRGDSKYHYPVEVDHWAKGWNVASPKAFAQRLVKEFKPPLSLEAFQCGAPVDVEPEQQARTFMLADHAHSWKQQLQESNRTITRYKCRGCSVWGFRRHTSRKSDVYITEYKERYEERNKPPITAQPNERPEVAILDVEGFVEE